MACTKDGSLGTWDTLQERVEDHYECGCVVCRDWLEREIPDRVLDDIKQDRLDTYLEA